MATRQTQLQSALRAADAVLQHAATALAGAPAPTEEPAPEDPPATGLAGQVARWAREVSPLNAPEHVRTQLAAAAREAGDSAPDGWELVVRRLDDALRQGVFRHLSAARRTPQEAAATAVASRWLGAPTEWVQAFRRYGSERLARAVLIVTWQCELRCSYCWIPKQDGRAMRPETAARAVDLLMSSHKPHVNLQFFGGEALLEFGVVQHAIQHAEARAEALGKTVDFVVSTNGWSLHGERLAWLARHPVKLELSLDGDPGTQATWRRSNVDGQDSYTQSIASHAAAIRGSGLVYDVIMVVQPRTVDRLRDNFFHIVDLGFDRVQINFALGVRWPARLVDGFAGQLRAIADEIAVRRSRGQTVVLVNAENAPLPIRLNGEIHVDFDGTVYGSNGFLNETDRKGEFAVGHLDDLSSFDRYWMDAPDNAFLLERTYPPEVTENNLSMGRIMASFVRWFRRHGLADAA